MKYKITIEYDGTNYVGWQKQPKLPSIQEKIEYAVTQFSKQVVEVYGSGRTDAGVHAIGQVAHLTLHKEYDEYRVLCALNYYLKNEAIAIIAVHKVNEQFHARFSANNRKYIYKIINRKAPLTIDRNLAWHVHTSLEITAMQQGAKFLLGTHDFSTFRAAECQAQSPIKTIDSIVLYHNQEIITFEITAKSFLHHQVRNMVGTLCQVGLGKWQPRDIEQAIQKQDRKYGGPTAPACGLYFHSVHYDDKRFVL